MAPSPLVAIFAKTPVQGRVKTRLAAGVGPRESVRIYRLMLERAVARLTRQDWRTELWVSPDADARRAEIWPGDLPRRAQGVGDLGARMARALRGASETCPVIVVGTDIPDLDAGHVMAALDALGRASIVFGPARDGGFYLVGLRAAPPPGLFRDVAWSAPDTMAAAARSAAPLTPAYLYPLEDLDDLEGLERNRGNPNWDTLWPAETKP